MKKEKGSSSKPWETSKEKPHGKGKGDDKKKGGKKK